MLTKALHEGPLTRLCPTQSLPGDGRPLREGYNSISQALPNKEEGFSCSSNFGVGAASLRLENVASGARPAVESDGYAGTLALQRSHCCTDSNKSSTLKMTRSAALSIIIAALLFESVDSLGCLNESVCDHLLGGH